MDWIKVRAAAKDFAIFLVLAIVPQVLATGRGVLDLSGADWRAVANAAITSALIVAVQWANSCNKAYGRGSK